MLGIIGNKFSIGKETYQPFAAELHYFRVDKRYWSICFERIKKAGFRIITSAVPWNIHQDDNKHMDFTGFDDQRRDLVVFLELAREFGFKVVLRPGPCVAGQMPYRGLPRFLFSDLKILARDSQGHEIRLPSDYGEDGGFLPSYLHRNFQFHLKSFFKAFIETTKNYVHPRGPIFMVELDYETSYGRLLDPGSADYNPDILETFYVRFLEERYDSIKKLNSLYHEKNADFSNVEPPRKFASLAQQDYPKVLDWFRFREWMLREYLELLEDVFRSYTVEPLLFRSLHFKSGELIPSYNLVPEDRAPFLGSNVFPEGTYFDLINKARFLNAEFGFAFASSFTSGVAATDPERESRLSPVGNNHRRFYYAAGLAAGFKGMNHYMFVDREHWYGAPLHSDGTVSEGYEIAKNFNMSISSINLEEMESKASIGVVVNRLYYWLTRTEAPKDFQYVDRLMNVATAGICRDLLRLKLPYGIRENSDWDTIKDYKLLVVPVTEVMAEKDQEALIESAKSGVTLVLIGVMPKYDENFKDCQVLANHLRLKTSVDSQIGTVSHKNGSFPCHIFGSIRSTDDSKIRTLCTWEKKTVGVCCTRLKGHVYLFSFDCASGGNHRKLSFIESILSSEDISTSLSCDDPSVDVAFLMGGKKGVLLIVVPPPGELSDGMGSRQKEIIINADLKPLGMSAPKLKLTNLLDDDEDAKPLKITAKDLKAGIPFRVDYPDGLIFHVEKRA